MTPEFAELDALLKQARDIAAGLSAWSIVVALDDLREEVEFAAAATDAINRP